MAAAPAHRPPLQDASPPRPCRRRDATTMLLLLLLPPPMIDWHTLVLGAWVYCAMLCAVLCGG
jgi:hypothetical protein